MTDKENQDILKAKLNNLKINLIKANYSIILALSNLDDIDNFVDSMNFN